MRFKIPIANAKLKKCSEGNSHRLHPQRAKKSYSAVSSGTRCTSISNGLASVFLVSTLQVSRINAHFPHVYPILKPLRLAFSRQGWLRCFGTGRIQENERFRHWISPPGRLVVLPVGYGRGIYPYRLCDILLKELEVETLFPEVITDGLQGFGYAFSKELLLVSIFCQVVLAKIFDSN
ncbi:MAG TPA: hypothetical protein VMW43_02140 [Bacteroidota bacterium]|nr:hypothetical protein [Bacteroidota bacterium]